MEKKKYVWLVLGCAVVVGIVVALLCGMRSGRKDGDAGNGGNAEGSEAGEDAESNGTEENGGSDEAGKNALTAMYVPFGENGHIFVSETAGVFEVTADRETLEVYDGNGEKIAFEELTRGNIVNIYGDEMMAESYPGQYPGVSRIEVVEEGDPSDADQYQYLVDEIYTEPDPAEPPFMQVEYATELMVSTVFTNRGGYEWVYMDQDGLSNAVVADSMPVLDWGELLIDIKLDEPVDLTLAFSKTPEEVEAVRYDPSYMGRASEAPEGEKVDVVQKDGQYMIEGAEGSYVYEITGIWENGRATYGFWTIQD